jgi:putative addiction module killer protein
VLVFRRSPEFNTWLDQLTDLRARARILTRLDRASLGNLGDCKPIGDGVSEMRVDVGPGYRIYFVRQGVEVYVLLVGGDKSSQKRDIQIALAMARELRQERDPHEH